MICGIGHINPSNYHNLTQLKQVPIYASKGDSYNVVNLFLLQQLRLIKTVEMGFNYSNVVEEKEYSWMNRMNDRSAKKKNKSDLIHNCLLTPFFSRSFSVRCCQKHTNDHNGSKPIIKKNRKKSKEKNSFELLFRDHKKIWRYRT